MSLIVTKDIIFDTGEIIITKGSVGCVYAGGKIETLAGTLVCEPRVQFDRYNTRHENIGVKGLPVGSMAIFDIDTLPKDSYRYVEKFKKASMYKRTREYIVDCLDDIKDFIRGLKK